MKYIYYSFLIIMLISCGNSSNTKVNKEGSDTEKEMPLFRIKNAQDINVSDFEFEGEIVNKKVWQDDNGENVVLFAIKAGEELFVYHYASEFNQTRLLRKVYDFEKDCEFDQTLEFVEQSIAITDLDKNGLGEITFAYKKACISDVSPLELKLLMLENGNKYIIRGNTLIKMGEETFGGNKTVDPTFEQAPPNFLSHANKVWSAIR